METIITGKAYVLGDNIDTDQIIPAQYLSFNPALPEERKFFGMYAISSVPEGQARPARRATSRSSARTNSRATTRSSSAAKTSAAARSREHAPLALAEAGIKCVIAEFYARIFFRNSVNGGYLVPLESNDRLVDKIRTGDELEVHLDDSYVINKTNNERYDLNPSATSCPSSKPAASSTTRRRRGC